MGKYRAIIFSILIQILSGLVIAFFTSLLVYFKQKELLHAGVVLFLVSALYYTASNVKNSVKFSDHYKIIAFVFLACIAIAGPQIIYQVRPYTFYISGMIIGVIAILILSSFALDEPKSFSISWNYSIFIIAFITGYVIPWISIQYLIAILLFIITVFFVIEAKTVFKLIATCSWIVIVSSYYLFSKPIIYHDAQVDYEDKVLYTANTQFHELVITQWQEDHWIFLDKLKNLSSIDEYLFYEPMAHSVFKVGNNITDVLIIGGENGCLAREVLKHENVHKIDVISYDTLMRNIGRTSEFFTHMNQYAYDNPKVKILYDNLINYISMTNQKYQAIFIDLPDPRSIEANQYYTIEFYSLVKKILTADGVMITQAGSPYFASRAYGSIGQTIKNAGFNILPIHNQILTLGEWGWYISSVNMERNMMKERLVDGTILKIETRWFNEEAAKLVSAFGKNYTDTQSLEINTLDNPWVYQYYLKGNWDLN